MSMVLVKTRDMERQEWLEWRRRGIGGSDAPKILGLSRFGSPFTVWLEKVGEAEPDEPGEAAYWGTKLEPIVANEFEARTGFKVRRVNQMLQHPEHSFMLANIDRRVVGRREGLEVKTSSAWRSGEWEGDEIPDEYYVQCQHYLAVTGYERWHIAALIGGQRFVHKVIERDDPFIEALIEAEKKFWWHVENRVAPEPDGSEAAQEFLNRKYATTSSETIELSSDARKWIEQYEYAKELEKQAEALKKEAENHLKAMLGECEAGHLGTWTVNWKSYVYSSLDTKALKQEMPEVYERYLRKTNTRRFTIQGTKEA